MAVHTHSDPVPISWDERDRKVVVTPENRDRYVTTVDAVLEACRIHQGGATFQKQFEQLLAELGQWLSDRAGDVHAAHIVVEANGLLFLVVRKTVKFNAELTEALADLEIQIHNDDRFSQLRLRALALPLVDEHGVKTFLGEHVLTYARCN